MTDVTDQERSENFFQTKYDELRKETREDQIEMAYLKKENEELNGKLQLNGTTVDQSGRLESFDDMTAERQRSELLKMVKDHDQRGAVINL